MYITPYFWGCKYTNKIRIINNNPVFQHIILFITFYREHHEQGTFDSIATIFTKRDNARENRRGVAIVNGTASEGAVTGLGCFPSQLRAKTYISGILRPRCVTFPLKTATARQITTAKRTQTDTFTYLCRKIDSCISGEMWRTDEEKDSEKGK